MVKSNFLIFHLGHSGRAPTQRGGCLQLPSNYESLEPYTCWLIAILYYKCQLLWKCDLAFLTTPFYDIQCHLLFQITHFILTIEILPSKDVIVHSVQTTNLTFFGKK